MGGWNIQLRSWSHLHLTHASWRKWMGKWLLDWAPWSGLWEREQQLVLCRDGRRDVHHVQQRFRGGRYPQSQPGGRLPDTADPVEAPRAPGYTRVPLPKERDGAAFQLYADAI